MDQKRVEIIMRASEVFMRYGIKSVTMDDLSRELGVSKKTIYKFFEDKNDLVCEILSQKLALDRATCDNCMSAENAIEELLCIGNVVVDHLKDVNPSVFYDIKKYHPDAWRLIEEHKSGFISENIRENIKRGIRENIYRKNVHPEIIARVYVASMDFIMNGDSFAWPEFKLDEVILEVQRFHLRGLANANGINYLNEKYNIQINE